MDCAQVEREKQCIIRRLRASIETVSMEENIDAQELCEWLLEFYKNGDALRAASPKESFLSKCGSVLKEAILGDFDTAFQNHENDSPYELEKAYGEAHGAAEFYKQIGPVMTVVGIMLSLYGTFVSLISSKSDDFWEIIAGALDSVLWIIIALFIVVFISWKQIGRASLTCAAIRTIQKQRAELAELKEDDCRKLNNKAKSGPEKKT